MPYAHSRNDQGQRHDLVAHLRSVAKLTADFAHSFGAAELGRRVGLWHDLGKFSQAFQDYLRDCDRELDRKGRRTDHKAAGALFAAQRLPPAALLIQGHHGGLRSPTDCQGWLAEFGPKPAVREALAAARAALPDLDLDGTPPLPSHLTDERSCELFLRLLFSALVDADFLDTEAHYHPERATERGIAPTLDMLWRLFERDQAQFAQPGPDAVNQTRHAIYGACLAAAEQPPGLFRLTVPTGGGKTRSALAFALRHALRHGQQRVIVAVPFISITEQTADVYRKIFEPTAAEQPIVLEHHTGVETAAADEEDFRRRQVWSRLAAENWDAPIIVTTTVQLFESLFDHRPGRCRKVHRLAKSVILLHDDLRLPDLTGRTRRTPGTGRTAWARSSGRSRWPLDVADFHLATCRQHRGRRERYAQEGLLLPVRCCQSGRPCAPDNTIRFATRALPVLPDRQRRSYTRARVAVQEWLDGSLVGRYQGRTLASRQAPVPPTAARKQVRPERASSGRPAGPAPAAPQGGTAPPAGHFHWTTTAIMVEACAA